MAREILDQTGNEDYGRSMSKINNMFEELYADRDESNTALQPVLEAVADPVPYSTTASDLAAALVAAGIMAPQA